MEEIKKRKFTIKQRKALELLTCGKGLTYKQIAEEVGVNPKTLWEWRNRPEYVMFQEELTRLNDERWLALVDAARASAMRLVEGDNQKMTEFVLKNAGYNPTQKIEADVKNDVVISIGWDEENNEDNI